MVPIGGPASFVLFGILVGLLSLEVFARGYVTFIEPALTISVNSIPDARLGVRPNPRDRGIDARGWRNAVALNRADIVVLGDSMEYGSGVRPDGAWPQRLGRHLHRPVYQMAMGGYGPGQYLLLFDDAATLKPKVLIAAYYLGNDIWDSYSLAYHSGDNAHTKQSLPLQALMSTDPNIRQAIRAAEAIDPGLLRYRYLDCDAHRAIPDPHLQQLHDILSAPPLAPLADKAASPPPAAISPSSPSRSRLRSLVNASVAYRLTRRSIDQAANRLFPSTAEDYGPPLCIHFQGGRLKTVFTVGPRLIALDTTDPRIVEGERISLLAYRALADRCRQAGIHFYVVLIMTKETAFRPRAEPLVGHEPYLRELWEAEAAARTRALSFFATTHVEMIDTLPALRAAIAAGINPYRDDWDGHPLAPGYDAIARAVAERLRHDGFGPPH